MIEDECFIDLETFYFLVVLVQTIAQDSSGITLMHSGLVGIYEAITEELKGTTGQPPRRREANNVLNFQLHFSSRVRYALCCVTALNLFYSPVKPRHRHASASSGYRNLQMRI